jgi:hypothetical protein
MASIAFGLVDVAADDLPELSKPPASFCSGASFGRHTLVLRMRRYSKPSKVKLPAFQSFDLQLFR